VKVTPVFKLAAADPLGIGTIIGKGKSEKVLCRIYG